MPQALPADIKKTAQQMLVNGLTPAQVAKELGLTRSAVKNWHTQSLDKPNIKNINEITKASAEKAVQLVVSREVNLLAKSVKTKMAMFVEAQAKALAEAAPDVSLADMRNTPERQGLAAVAKTVAETAASVFGESLGSASLSLRSLDSIEVETSSCGQDATTNGGSPNCGVSENTQGPK